MAIFQDIFKGFALTLPENVKALKVILYLSLINTSKT